MTTVNIPYLWLLPPSCDVDIPPWSLRIPCGERSSGARTSLTCFHGIASVTFCTVCKRHIPTAERNSSRPDLRGYGFQRGALWYFQKFQTLGPRSHPCRPCRCLLGLQSSHWQSQYCVSHPTMCPSAPVVVRCPRLKLSSSVVYVLVAQCVQPLPVVSQVHTFTLNSSSTVLQKTQNVSVHLMFNIHKSNYITLH